MIKEAKENLKFYEDLIFNPFKLSGLITNFERSYPCEDGSGFEPLLVGNRKYDQQTETVTFYELNEKYEEINYTVTLYEYVNIQIVNGVSVAIFMINAGIKRIEKDNKYNDYRKESEQYVSSMITYIGFLAARLEKTSSLLEYKAVIVKSLNDIKEYYLDLFPSLNNQSKPLSQEHLLTNIEEEDNEVVSFQLNITDLKYRGKFIDIVHKLLSLLVKHKFVKSDKITFEQILGMSKPVKGKVYWNASYVSLSYFITALVDSNMLRAPHGKWKTTVHCFSYKNKQIIEQQVHNVKEPVDTTIIDEVLSAVGIERVNNDNNTFKWIFSIEKAKLS